MWLTKVLPGSDLTIPCYAQGNPLPEMSWEELGEGNENAGAVSVDGIKNDLAIKADRPAKYRYGRKAGDLRRKVNMHVCMFIRMHNSNYYSEKKISVTILDTVNNIKAAIYHCTAPIC